MMVGEPVAASRIAPVPIRPRLDAGIIEPSSAAPIQIIRSRKGKNFVPDEEIQLCKSFLLVSQESFTRDGQRSTTFWGRVGEHYNSNRPASRAERPARSLETRWGIIKHDTVKFVGCYEEVLMSTANNESGSSSSFSLEEKLQKALELYKLKHPKGQSFLFIHCWLILRDVPRWAESREDSKKAITPQTPLPMKRPAGSLSADVQTLDEEVMDLENSSSSKAVKRPMEDNRGGKDAHKSAKSKECALRAQAKATADMAAAIMKKASIMEDQSVMALFTMPDDQLQSPEAKEYFKLRRDEELQKLRSRLQAPKP